MLEVMQPTVPGILQPVFDCLDLFRQEVEGCFSWNLVADFQEKIEAFTNSYSDLMSFSQVHYWCGFTCIKCISR